MPKIIIKRTSEFANKFRSIGLYINNKKIGSIQDGKSLEFDIEPGSHLIEAKIDWCSSNVIHVDIKDNETQRFLLSGRNPFTSLYYVMADVNNYLKLESIA
ncbi:hypothetical protein [Flavobacterium wongokense]|uniref:hypothetical protein n=1 Tax=Flavobacterium wongokense TaxID=2910674 RepID=UPI001F15BF3B|nr:hypothetical protein [Flavobacterium sp. WG47]MCF6132196.1 hypothetical protein [Flavobacterium sp. WG47]